MCVCMCACHITLFVTQKLPYTMKVQTRISFDGLYIFLMSRIYLIKLSRIVFSRRKVNTDRISYKYSIVNILASDILIKLKI